MRNTELNNRKKSKTLKTNEMISWNLMNIVSNLEKVISRDSRNCDIIDQMTKSFIHKIIIGRKMMWIISELKNESSK